MLQPFASVLIFIAAIALITSLRSIMTLHRLGKLKATFWKQQGIKNFTLYFIWVALLVGGIGLLLEESWGKFWTIVALWGLFFTFLINGFLRIAGLSLFSRLFKQDNDLTEGRAQVRSGITGVLFVMIVMLLLILLAIRFVYHLPL